MKIDKMVTDEEMEQALKKIRQGCKERRCSDCPIAFECESYFISECSPATWEMGIDEN